MVRLIIADDEPVILNGIKNMFDWDSLGIYVVALCDNGEDVLKLIKDNACDLLISDIRMPSVTGIEIAKYIKEHSLPVHVIFISGFSEFSYAQEALRYGALDYLTKPVEQNTLLAVLTDAVSLIESMNTRDELKKRLLGYDVLGEIRRGGEPSCDMMQYLESQTPKTDYTAIAVRLEDLEGTAQENDLVRFSVFEKLEQYIEGAGIAFYKESYICLLVNHGKVLPQSIYRMACNIASVIKETMNQTITVLIGKSVSGMEDIVKSYESAAELEDVVYYLQKGSVLDHFHIPKRMGGYEFKDLTDMERQIAYEMQLEEAGNLPRNIDKAMEIIVDISLYKPQISKSYILSMMKYIRQSICESAAASEVNQKVNELAERFNASIITSQYFSEVCALAKERLFDIREAVLSSDAVLPDEIIKVKEYLNRHYSEDITLESTANHVHLNPFYFSSFFKKHMHTNFKEYLTAIRMERAVQLLLGTNLRTSEIAEQTGFKSARNFGVTFKKIYGKTHREYKDSFKKQ